MEDTIMIRLSFKDDEEILSPYQKSEGLNLCWLLLKPQLHKIIADITDQILHGFQLHNSCPHGIHLYSDGFPLRPFEPTGILSISDTISVRKRATLSLEASLKGQEVGKYQLRGLEEGGNATFKKRKASANLHITKKKKQRSSHKESFQRSANKVLKSIQVKVRSSEENIQKQEHNPKNKKQANNGKDKITNSDMEISADTKSCDEIQNNANDALEGLVESKKISRSALCKMARRKWQWELVKVELEKQNKIVQNGLQYSKETLAVSKADTSQPKSCPSGEQTRPKSEQKNRDGKRDDGEPKELNSRSARRKKAKRQWLRESKRNGYRYADTIHPNTRFLESNMHGMKKHYSGVQDDATANKFRKSSHDKVEASLAIIQKQELNLKKKKQAENGKDNINTSNMKISADTKISDEIQNNANDALEEPVETKKISRSARRLRAKRQRLREFKAEKQYSEVTLAMSKADTSQPKSCQREEQTRPKSGQKNRKEKRDFDKLPPLCDLTKFVDPCPFKKEKEKKQSMHKKNYLSKAGDVIVYRLLELSSSWTPELSHFRVGKVSWCSSETGKLLLMPVPEYPISSGMSVDDESHSQPDNSLYNEDGSLEIDFTALVDVRLLEDGSGGLTSSAEKAFGYPVDASALVVPSPSNDRQSNVSTKNGEAQPGKLKNGSSTENGVDIWEQASEALKSKKERTGNTWSYRTLNSRALGPTMTLLSCDEIQNNSNDALEGPVETKKISRSALRKKAKRKWQSELAKAEKQDEIAQNGLQYSKETLAVSKADTSQLKSCPSGEQTRPKSEQKNRDGIRDDVEPKGLNSRSARRKKAKRQCLREFKRESKRHEYGHADTRYASTRFLESRTHRYGYVDTRYADTRYANTR